MKKEEEKSDRRIMSCPDPIGTVVVKWVSSGKVVYPLPPRGKAASLAMGLLKFSLAILLIEIQTAPCQGPQPGMGVEDPTVEANTGPTLLVWPTPPLHHPVPPLLPDLTGLNPNYHLSICTTWGAVQAVPTPQVP